MNDNTNVHRWFWIPAALIHGYYTEITDIISGSTHSITLHEAGTLGGIHPSGFVKLHHKSGVKKVITTQAFYDSSVTT